MGGNASVSNPYADSYADRKVKYERALSPQTQHHKSGAYEPPCKVELLQGCEMQGHTIIVHTIIVHYNRHNTLTYSCVCVCGVFVCVAALTFLCGDKWC